MQTPILETERLILRPLTCADAEEIFANWTSDADVAKFIRWNTHTSADETRGWLAFVEKNIESDTDYDWGFIRKADNKIIGSGGLYFKEEHGCFEMGYNTMKACWHQGYTTEAAAAMAKFAFEALGEQKLFAAHAKENPNSGKVMEKIGFRYVKDGHYESFDGLRHYETRDYFLEK